MFNIHKFVNEDGLHYATWLDKKLTIVSHLVVIQRLPKTFRLGNQWAIV